MATVVSAYFRIPSKFPQEFYLHWIKNFLEHIPCHLVFYTDPELVPLFTSWRGQYMDRTVFIPFNLDDAEAYKKYGRAFWDAELEKDTEYDWQTGTTHIYNPRLYAIWYEKKEFVLKTIAANPFNHEKFLWCDAGGFRITSWFDALQEFPNPDMIHSTKFVIINIKPFTDSELSSFPDFSKLDRIGAGYLAGSAHTWKRFSEKYDNMIKIYKEKGFFIGKEQNIMASMYIEDPEFFDLVLTNTICEDMWFYPQLYFSQKTEDLPDVTIIMPIYNGIEFLPISLGSICQQTYKKWSVLIGINGHEPNSDVFKKATLIAKSLTDKYKLSSHQIKIVDLHLTIKGKPAASNKLIQFVKTPWISVLDVDDFWMPNKLEQQEPFMKSFDVIGSLCQYFGDISNIPYIPVGDISNYNFLEVCPIINSSVLMKTSLAKWGENEILDDYELWLRLRYKENNIKFFNVSEILVGHRIHKQSAFNNTSAKYLPDLLAKYRN